MKKAVMMLALAMFVGTAAFAEMAGAPASMMGKIKSVETGNPQTGIKPQLVIVDDAGKTSKLMLSPATAISDAAGKTLTIAQLTAGEKVKVQKTAQGVSSVQVEA